MAPLHQTLVQEVDADCKFWNISQIRSLSESKDFNILNLVFYEQLKNPT